MNRSEIPPYKTASFVLPQWKTVYVSVPKAACTSLKWLVADLQDESPDSFHGAVSRETSRHMTIHHRALWQNTPMLAQLDDAELEAVSPENGWFVFAVVRHPSTRLWSAWQSKFLLQEPRFRNRHPEAPWPDRPRSTSEVVEAFTDFVRYLDQGPDVPILKDRHFRAQAHLLRVSRTPYSRVYRTNEIPLLLDDLAAHVRPLGLHSLPPLRRSNETPLRPLSALFPPEVQQVVQRLYRQDFAKLGYPPGIPDGLSEGEYLPEQLAEIDRLVARAERVDDLYKATMRARRAARRAEAEVGRLRAQATHRPLGVRALHRAASRLRSP